MLSGIGFLITSIGFACNVGFDGRKASLLWLLVFSSPIGYIQGRVGALATISPIERRFNVDRGRFECGICLTFFRVSWAFFTGGCIRGVISVLRFILIEAPISIWILSTAAGPAW